MTQEATPRAKLGGILEKVRDNIVDGRVFFLIVRHFQEAQLDGPLPRNRWLFRGITVGCLGSALMALSRLLEQQEGAITLSYLLNYAEQNPGEFQHATPDEVKEAVRRCRTWFNDITVWNTLQSLRNRTLAHTDQRHLTDPAAVAIDPLESAALDEAFQQVLLFYIAVLKLYDGSTMPLNDIEHFVRHDFCFLIGLYEKEWREQEAHREMLRQQLKKPPS
jgi:hypothetical protein